MSQPMPEALTVPVPAGALGLVLPLPVSVNNLREVRPVWTKKGRKHIPVKTDQANTWSAMAGWELRRRYPGVTCPAPPLAVRVRLLVRSAGRFDVDNVGKQILDALLPALGVNDALVFDWHVRKIIMHPRKGGPVRCEVVIMSMEAADAEPGLE